MSQRQYKIESSPAFTIVELLVVIAVIGVMASLLLPALAKTKARAQAIGSLNNGKQLTFAWMSYAHDNNDLLPYNLALAGMQRSAAAKNNLNWINNVMTWELDADNTNTALLARSPLAPYLGQATDVFRCPADRVLSSVQQQAGWQARVRSYSMNARIGEASTGRPSAASQAQFTTMSDVPEPSRVFVFVEEHPDSINDGSFKANAADYEWVDLPASDHNGAGIFSFADGHTEIHGWAHEATKRPSRPDGAQLPFYVSSDEQKDFEWVASRVSGEPVGHERYP